MISFASHWLGYVAHTGFIPPPTLTLPAAPGSPLHSPATLLSRPSPTPRPSTPSRHCPRIGLSSVPSSHSNTRSAFSSPGQPFLFHPPSLRLKHSQAPLLLGVENHIPALHLAPTDPGSSPFQTPSLSLTTPLQGYVYVYKTLLEPWLAKNEADLDLAMISAQTNTIAFCRTRITALVDLVWRFLNKSHESPATGDAQKPPVSVDHIKGLWTTYGPSVLAAFAPKDTSEAHVSATREETHPYSAN